MKSKVRMYRKMMDLTQRDLARDLKIARQTIVAIERGHYNPSLEIAFRLAMFFEVPVEELFVYEPPEWMNV